MRTAFSFGAPGARYVPLREQERQQQSQQDGLPPLGLINQFAGNNGFLGGLGGQAGGGSSGAGSTLASAGPWAALAAAIALNENYQGNIGNRDGESFPLEYALRGDAFAKDAPGWAEKANDILPGSGGGIETAGLLSKPWAVADGDTYKGVWDHVKGGGTLGGILKGLF